jgi:hypothetical protein
MCTSARVRYPVAKSEVSTRLTGCTITCISIKAGLFCHFIGIGGLMCRKFHESWNCNGMAPFKSFFSRNSTHLLIVINKSTKIFKINKIINRPLDRLATTTNTSTNRADVLATPSSKPGKTCCTRVCYSRQVKIRRAKIQEDQRKNDNHHQ